MASETRISHNSEHTHPAKRLRSEDPPRPIVRSELWKSDGNIVLQAERTQFKIHRSTLADNSSVFRDMFSLPPQPPEEDAVEGCPLVVLSDHPYDWLNVLKALYERQ